MMDISTASALAMIVLAFIGSGAYFVFYGISKYREQKAQAEELKAKIVTSGRDPADASALTIKEKWEISKCQKFDKIFLVADILGVIISTGVAVAVMYFYGIQAGRIADDWAMVGATAFIAGVIAAWFINETLVQTAANGEWQKKAKEAFRTIEPALAEATASIVKSTRMDELVQKYLEAGFSKKEAKQAAKEKLIEEME